MPRRPTSEILQGSMHSGHQRYIEMSCQSHSLAAYPQGNGPWPHKHSEFGDKERNPEFPVRIWALAIWSIIRHLTDQGIAANHSREMSCLGDYRYI